MKASAKMLPFVLTILWGGACVCSLFVWIRWLILLFGYTPSLTINISVALVTGFAAAVSISSHAAERSGKSRVRILALFGLATGAYGLTTIWIFHRMEMWYWAAAPALARHAGGLLAAQVLFTLVFLMLPVIAMSGWLRLQVRGVTDTRGPISSGTVYGSTVIGAGAGVITMIYLLAPKIGFTSVLSLAAGVQIAVSFGIFGRGLCLRRDAVPELRAPEVPDRGLSSIAALDWRIRIGVAATGFALSAFDICAARLLGMVFGPSIYTYGAYFAVVFFGIGIGSCIQARLSTEETIRKPQIAELASFAAVSLAISTIVLRRAPFLFAHFFPALRVSFARQTAAEFCASAAVGFLPSLFFGAMLPQSISNFHSAGKCFRARVASVCTSNAIGIAAGVCVAAIVVIPRIGLHLTAIAAMMVPVAAAAISVRIRGQRLYRLLSIAGVGSALIAIAALARWPVNAFADADPEPARQTDQAVAKRVSPRLLYYRDGFRSTISVDNSGPLTFLRVSGKIEDSSNPVDVGGQLLLGHLPMLLHPAVRDVLILGLNTGRTAAAVSHYDVQRIDLVEEEPAAVQAAAFFQSSSGKVLEDSRVHPMIDTIRNRLLTSRQSYDVVISDFSHPWGQGIGSTATLEFYRMVASRLESGGLLAQRVSVEGLKPDDLDRFAATFHRVFPHVEMWTSSPGNLIFLGSREAITWDFSRLQQQFRHTRGVSDELNSIGIWRPVALFGAELLGQNETDAFTRNVGELNTDDRPVLAFGTARAVYEDTRSSIAREINPFRRPEAPQMAGFDPQHDLDADDTYLLGFAYASMGQADLGIRYMEKSTAMAPDRPMFYVGLGNQYRVMGRTTEARMAYERALSLDLNNVEALVSLGEIRLDEGQLEWARVLSERALRLAPQDSRVHALMDRLEEIER